MSKTLLEAFLERCRFAFDGISASECLEHKKKVKRYGATVDYLVTTLVCIPSALAYLTDYVLGGHS
jgi:hypothetical protein